MNQSKLNVCLVAVMAFFGSVFFAACGTNHTTPTADISCVSATPQQVIAAQAKVTADTAKVTADHGNPSTGKDQAQENKDTATLNSLKATASSAACKGGSTTTTAATSICPNSWAVSTQTAANGRWVADGVPEIQQASTPAQASKAAAAWLNDIKGTPGLLAGASSYLLNKQVDPATLDSNGCATPAAVNLVSALQVSLSLSDVTPTQAPTDATNTLTSSGVVLAEATPGISGNRKAIEIQTAKGVTVWVMARCGNAVKQGTPPVPTVPPKQPAPAPTPTTPNTVPPCIAAGGHFSTVPGYTHVCVFPKDPSKDPMNNPAVPAQVKGPGTTPVGVSPGPATKPVDSPTGCNGPCPVPPSAATTTTTAPATTPSTAPPDTTPASQQPTNTTNPSSPPVTQPSSS